MVFLIASIAQGDVVHFLFATTAQPLLLWLLLLHACWAKTFMYHKSCYNCMSKEYEQHWDTLKAVYRRPHNFTDLCADGRFRGQQVSIQQCAGACITIQEPNTLGGIIVGYFYIRGCHNKILVKGFNETAFSMHRFRHLETCRTLHRRELFHEDQSPYDDVVRMCSCFGELCNHAQAKNTLNAVVLGMVALTVAFLQQRFAAIT